jgi:hypothetical protein
MALTELNCEHANAANNDILPPFLFTCRQLVQKLTNRRQVKRNGGSTKQNKTESSD